MESRSQKKGLTNPTNAMMNDLNRERLNVTMYRKRQQQLLGGVDDEQEQEDDMEAAERAIPQEMTQLDLEEIQYEVDV